MDQLVGLFKRQSTAPETNANWRSERRSWPPRSSQITWNLAAPCPYINHSLGPKKPASASNFRSREQDGLPCSPRAAYRLPGRPPRGHHRPVWQQRWCAWRRRGRVLAGRRRSSACRRGVRLELKPGWAAEVKEVALLARVQIMSKLWCTPYLNNVSASRCGYLVFGHTESQIWNQMPWKNVWFDTYPSGKTSFKMLMAETTKQAQLPYIIPPQHFSFNLYHQNCVAL